jgi:toxin secretion/phage lysis holin
MEFINWLGVRFSEIFSQSNHLLYALIFFVVLDYITGVCLAIYQKKLSSQIGAKGITKKVAIFIVIAFCAVLDSYLVSTGEILANVASIFYLCNEGISILENIGKMDVPLPKKVQSALLHLKDEVDEEDSEQE